MTTLRLCRIVSGNPFGDHPQLRTIWDRAWCEHVESDTLSDLAKGTTDEAGNHVLLIQDEQSQVVGITGFYLLSQRRIGLRWHGIIPKCRGKGLLQARISGSLPSCSRNNNRLGHCGIC